MKLNYKDWNLKYKILFAAVLPFVLAAIITIPILAGSIITNMEYKSKLYADKIVYGLSLVIQLQAERYINQVIEQSEILSAISNHGTLNDAIINQILSHSLKRNKSFESAWVILEANNKNIYWQKLEDGSTSPTHLNLSESPLVKELLAQSKVSKDISMRIQQKPSNNNLLLISHPIIDNQNNYIGTIGLNIHLEKLANILKEAGNYGIQIADLINEHGLSVASFNKTSQLYAVSKLSKYIRDVYNIYIPIKFTGTSDYWILHASYPLDPGHIEVYTNLSLMGLIFALCLGIGISISILTSKAISLPIQQISIALTKITEGDFTTKIPDIDSNDEVARIAKATEVLKQHSYDLVTAKKEAEAANIAKTDFLANMSHELRTPMHAILSYTKLSLDKITPKDSSLTKYLTNITTSGERLLNLLNHLLDLAKLEAGKVTFNFMPYDINICIHEVLAELNPLITNKNIKIALRLLKTNSIVALDKEKFTQVLINVLSNAIKFSNSKGTITISITHPNAKQLLISIQDEGVGVPKKEIDTIFDKFAQSSKTNKGAGGTGLGLSIARSIVTAHKGKIWAKSKSNLGATFNILIPITHSEQTDNKGI